MAEKETLILVIGDLHIPYRAADVPAQFKEILVPRKVSSILFTGNLTSKESLDWLRGICPDIHLVSGDYDPASMSLPQTLSVVLNGIRFGIVHGHQVVPWGDPKALDIWTRRLDCDVLVSGHTHVPSIHKEGSKLLLNPGSATGAYSPTAPSTPPSFMLLRVTGRTIQVFSYSLGADDKVKVCSMPSLPLCSCYHAYSHQLEREEFVVGDQ